MHYLCTAFSEEKHSGCSSVRLECLVWDQVVEGSNPFIPTKKGAAWLLFLFQDLVCLEALNELLGRDVDLLFGVGRHE